MSTLVPCVECGEPVDATAKTVVVEHIGFAPRSRKGGGEHGLKRRRETGRVMCNRCYLAINLPGGRQQGALT
jgi:hypothetical protein